MKSVYNLFFVVALFTSFFALSLYMSGGCATVPNDGMPDPEDDPPVVVDTLVVADTLVFGDTSFVCQATLAGGDTVNVVCDTLIARVAVDTLVFGDTLAVCASTVIGVDTAAVVCDTLIMRMAVDTLVFGDTLAVCVSTVIGVDTAAVVCDTVVLGGIRVPYMVTRIDGEVNGYCFYPITFTAFPRPEDLAHISGIYLDWDVSDEASSPPVLLSPPTYSAVFSYADTGIHSARMRVNMRGSDFVLKEPFEVRTAERIEADPVSIFVSDTGGAVHTFRAGGYRPRDVFWVWDLTNIGSGVISALEDTVSVLITGDHDTVVFVYQRDAAGRRTPGREVRFVSVVVPVDTVKPAVEIVWPYDPLLTPGAVCNYGMLAYRLNKQMAWGYIRWTSLNPTITYQHPDSVMAVRLPEDIRVGTHSVANRDYSVPREYLAPGLHKYSHYISPREGRRFTEDIEGIYRLAMVFADTLGNITDTLVYAVNNSPRVGNMGWVLACRTETENFTELK